MTLPPLYYRFSDPPDSPPDLPPEHQDTKSCSLVGPVALVVQALMAVLVIASLLVKRQYEGGPRSRVPRRKWKVWVFDVSKQLIGQSLIHGSNLLISDQVAHGGGNNPCSLYFLNVLVDTTIGVLVLYLSLKGLTMACASIWGDQGFTSGIYGHPPNIHFWAKQLGVYLAALLMMKIFVLALFAFALDPVLLPLAGWILNWMQEWSQVVFVMAIFPLFMNILQFCLIDSLIKGREPGSEDDDAYHYTAASIGPKDLEEATGITDPLLEGAASTSDSSPSQPRFRNSVRTTHAESDMDTERGRAKSRESSRASSRFRGGSRTPRNTGSRPLTPIPKSPLLDPVTGRSNGKAAIRGEDSLKIRSEAMRRTKSSDGYGSTGSTEPSPRPRALKLSDDDVFALGEDDDAFPVSDIATIANKDREMVDPDATPKCGFTSGRFSVPPALPKRMDDQVRIQARRSLSSEGNVTRNGHRSKRMGHDRRTRQDSETSSVVMLDEV